MQFVVQYLDRADSGNLRVTHRDAHIGYRKGLGPKLLLAGPLLSDLGAALGSLVILETETFHEAQQIAAADPYVAAGVFRDIHVYGYRVVANRFPTPSSSGPHPP